MLYKDSVITFGKYKEDHLTLDQIVKKDPQYIIWCIKKISWFEVEESVLEQLQKVPSTKKAYSRRESDYCKYDRSEDEERQRDAEGWDEIRELDLSANPYSPLDDGW